MKRVAIVGSRRYPHPEAVRACVARIAERVDAKDIAVLSGGAAGVDSIAVDEARTLGLAVEVLPAPWEMLPRWLAGHIRNAVVVARSDAVIAFWDGKSNGTRSTILIAHWLDVPCTVYGPDAQRMHGEVAPWQ
jgi:hypothetical protein